MFVVVDGFGKTVSVGSFRFRGGFGLLWARVCWKRESDDEVEREGSERDGYGCLGRWVEGLGSLGLGKRRRRRQVGERERIRERKSGGEGVLSGVGPAEPAGPVH